MHSGNREWRDGFFSTIWCFSRHPRYKNVTGWVPSFLQKSQLIITSLKFLLKCIFYKFLSNVF